MTTILSDVFTIGIVFFVIVFIVSKITKTPINDVLKKIIGFFKEEEDGNG